MKAKKPLLYRAVSWVAGMFFALVWVVLTGVLWVLIEGSRWVRGKEHRH